MDIDYNKLKTFLKLVQEGSVTRAAKALNRTQSAVSQSIRGLEQNLGLTLIQWEGKRLKLTREGQLIHKEIHARMAAIEEQLNTIIKAGVELGGCIEIGILQDHSTKIQERLPHILSEFRKKYPLITFKAYFATSGEIEEGLLEETLDIGLLINFRERHRFHVFEVASEEHLVVASSDYLKQVGQPNSIQDIISADLIDIDETFTCLTPWVQRNSRELVPMLDEKKPVIVMPDFRAAKELILLGQGIGVIPKYLIENELRSGRIVQLMPELSTLKVGVDCATLRGQRERLCERIFIDELQKI